MSTDWRSLPSFQLAAAVVDASAPGTHVEVVRVLGRLRCIGPSFFDAVKNDPGHLTDLRLKASADPRDAFLGVAGDLPQPDAMTQFLNELSSWDRLAAGIAAALGLSPRPSADAELRALATRHRPHSDEVISQVLCCYVNCLGSWDDAVVVATAIEEDGQDLPATDSAALLLQLCANALAAGSLPEARKLYQLSFDRWSDEWERCITLLRWATAETKRLGSPAEASRLAVLGLQALRRLEAAGYSTSDHLVGRALFQNLQALLALKHGDIAAAKGLLYDAVAGIDNAGRAEINLPLDVVDRYRFMLEWNLAALDLREGNNDSATNRFRRLSDGNVTFDAASKGEALGALGMCLLRAKCPREAINVLMAALGDSSELRPTHRREVQRLLGLAHYGVGDNSKCREMLRLARA